MVASKSSSLVSGNWKKLTPFDAAEMRVLAEAGHGKAAIARKFNVTPYTVRYHTLHAKSGATPYAIVLEAAVDLRRRGNHKAAAAKLREAAAILEAL